VYPQPDSLRLGGTRIGKGSGGLLIAAPDTASRDETRQSNATLNNPSLVHRVDLRSTDAIQRVEALVEGRLNPLAESENNRIVCNLHLEDESSATRFLTAVNLEREEQSTTLSLSLPGKGYKALDMLTGESITVARDGDLVQLPLTIDGVWGRVILLTPTPPVNISVDAEVANQQLIYRVKLTGEGGIALDYPSVCTITVTDPEGNERIEYGGRLVTTDGQLARTLPLPINAMPGEWTVVVREGASTLEASTTYMIERH